VFRTKLVIGLVLVTLSGGFSVASAESTSRENLGVTFAEAAQPQLAPAGWFRIRSLYGDGSQCLDADVNNGGNGTKVQVWTCTDALQQLWFWTDDKRVINRAFPTMCLDADTNGGGADGTIVQLWQCNGSLQQQWGVLPNDVAIYNDLFFNNANTVLDRDTNTPGNGAQVQLWTKNFEPQQWWRPESVGI
jgi:hypothetical protein